MDRLSGHQRQLGQILRDLTAVESVPWDLIVLDEGQRIKNWESKTSNVIQLLQSTYRLVLSGTPLENNLGELFTVSRFVDEHRLGPAYQFFNRHRVVDERGRTIGYQRLDELRETIRPILLRRTRAEVAKQLPERTDEIVRIERRLDTIGCDHVRLDGQVPQKNRAEIVARFQDDPNCRVILMTNAGSTGLNLQSANTVINVDLPWNPAVLEQRIARAHRMGQQNPVHV